MLCPLFSFRFGINLPNPIQQPLGIILRGVNNEKLHLSRMWDAVKIMMWDFEGCYD